MAHRLRRSTPYTIQTFSLPVDLRHRLEASVARNELSASELLRRALTAFLRRDEQKAKRTTPQDPRALQRA